MDNNYPATPAPAVAETGVEEAQDRRRLALIERLGTIADMANEKPLGGDLGDVAYDLLRQAAAQIASDRQRLAALPRDPADKARVEELEAALKLAVSHVKHLANWISGLQQSGESSGYSFEALGEGLPGMEATLNPTADEGGK